MLIGYARVSTDGQSVDSQVDSLRTAGCERIFYETASGAKRERAALAKAIAALRSGDMLIVYRLDRLARSTLDLLSTLDTLQKKGAGFRSLCDVWADTTTPHGRLMLTVLGGLAEFERSLILARTSEGRARAVARGVKMGHPFSLTPHQTREVEERLKQGEAHRDIARSYDVGRSTIDRISRRMNAAVTMNVTLGSKAKPPSHPD